MSVRARETVPGRLYRPTRNTDIAGRSVLRRPTPGREAAAIRRMERLHMRLNGQEVMVLITVKAGSILFRMDTRFAGATRSRWVAIPPTYTLREVKA